MADSSTDAARLQGKAEAILDAAERLFTRLGYRKTAMDDIATESGVAKGTLYLYFESKEALFCAIQTQNIAHAERLCDAAAARGGDLAERICGQLEAWFGVMFDRYGASDHLRELSAARLSISRQIAGKADRSYEARLREVILDAVLRGEADLTPTGLGAAAIVALMLSASRGAKFKSGSPVRQTDFHASLRGISQVFAAAIQVR